MVDFSGLVLEEGTPIYAQLVRFAKGGLVAGTIAHQEEMPSRRMLSALLGVNPNTIQKAYRILEEEGLMESRSGAKSQITATAQQISALRIQLQGAELGRMVDILQGVGLSKEAALVEFARVWDERGGKS